VITNVEKELLLKLLMEKATKVDSVNLSLVQTPTPRKRGSGTGRRPKGVRVWTQEEMNYLKAALAAGKSEKEIAKVLDRTYKSVNSRLYLLRKGRIA
jgi:DNA-binding NarL/FixJ family response regulator